MLADITSDVNDSSVRKTEINTWINKIKNVGTHSHQFKSIFPPFYSLKLGI